MKSNLKQAWLEDRIKITEERLIRLRKALNNSELTDSERAVLNQTVSRCSARLVEYKNEGKQVK